MTIKAQQRGLTREVDFNTYQQEKSPDIELLWGKGVEDVLEELDLTFVEDALEGVAEFATFLGAVVDVVSSAAEYLILLIGREITDPAELLILTLQEALKTFQNLFIVRLRGMGKMALIRTKRDMI